MKVLKRSTPLLLALALIGSAQAADLLEVYRAGLANDAQYGAARALLEAGREKLPQGRAGLLPTLGITANSTWNDTQTNVRTGGQVSPKYNANGYTVQLNQPLFRWQNWVQYDQAKLQVAQVEASFVAAHQDLILRTAQAYFDALLAQDALDFAKAQKAAIKEQLAQAQRNFEVGTSTIVDSHEAQARFDLATAQELAAQSDLEVKYHALRVITGQDMAVLKHLPAKVRIDPPQPADMAAWVKAAETENANVQAGQFGAEAASREVDRQHAAHLPTLDLVASRGRSSTSAGTSLLATSATDTYSNTIGVQLNVPIFQGGVTSSRTREASAMYQKALQDLENTRRTVALASRQAYLGVTSGIAQVKALEAGLVSSQSSLDSNKLGYEVGVRINIDVLNAQQQVFSTRRDLAKARYDTLVAQLKLKAAAGSLGEDDVRQVNSLLEP